MVHSPLFFGFYIVVKRGGLSECLRGCSERLEVPELTQLICSESAIDLKTNIF